MSIIEQAARRLEELRAAGFEVAIRPLPAPVGDAGEIVPREVTVTARAANEEALMPEAARPAGLPAEPAVRRVPLTRVPAPVPAAPLRVEPDAAGRRSREVSLDLVRLERDGYLVPAKARSLLAEQLRIIKRPLLANARGEGAQVSSRANLIQVVSAMPGEGKTFFAMNLAMSIAMEVDHSVLLIDADVLRPSVMARCGVESGPGLLDLLGSEDVGLSDVMLRTNVPKLSLMPAGTASSQSTELLASAAMERLLDELAAKYADRIIVFDAPPLIPTTESRVLASRMGQVVMVVEANRTTHQQVTQAFAALEDCPIVLTVLNKSTGVGRTDGYGYYYAR
ncbi:exopolysaccharide/PEP-CTERM locus tyrosine autokinase [Sphaerotilus hippei]|uniref:non-specific protein-tyrosine kinase n=1 Tax=Sphaerotilus hippei TaxID=744406 RepID=A0A318H0W3_9BURK|nr:XrtA-associated tyrosine autokinase [Sphaerotilus hippei]PXW94125.1 exopolysaccharide/PEP-CTERM locus tyrosine autokinase [Sphaerotilus hippei]